MCRMLGSSSSTLLRTSLWMIGMSVFIKTAEGIRVGMVGHACKHDQKVRLPVVWFQITRLNVVVGANACVISAGFLFPLSEPTMGFGWVMPCVTCTFYESSWRTGSVSSDTWRQSLTRCLCNYQVCCVNESLVPQCRRGTWALAEGSNSVIKMIGG